MRHFELRHELVTSGGTQFKCSAWVAQATTCLTDSRSLEAQKSSLSSLLKFGTLVGSSGDRLRSGVAGGRDQNVYAELQVRIIHPLPARAEIWMAGGLCLRW